jgi:hypothetical protein
MPCYLWPRSFQIRMAGPNDNAKKKKKRRSNNGTILTLQVRSVTLEICSLLAGRVLRSASLVLFHPSPGSCLHMHSLDHSTERHVRVVHALLVQSGMRICPSVWQRTKPQFHTNLHHINYPAKAGYQWPVGKFSRERK